MKTRSKLSSAFPFAGLATLVFALALSPSVPAAILTPSDGAAGDQFGSTVSQSGALALVGTADFSSNLDTAYIFRNLDTATGPLTENAKLRDPDS